MEISKCDRETHTHGWYFDDPADVYALRIEECRRLQDYETLDSYFVPEQHGSYKRADVENARESAKSASISHGVNLCYGDFAGTAAEILFSDAGHVDEIGFCPATRYCGSQCV